MPSAASGGVVPSRRYQALSLAYRVRSQGGMPDIEPARPGCSLLLLSGGGTSGAIWGSLGSALRCVLPPDQRDLLGRCLQTATSAQRSEGALCVVSVGSAVSLSLALAARLDCAVAVLDSVPVRPACEDAPQPVPRFFQCAETLADSIWLDLGQRAESQLLPTLMVRRRSSAGWDWLDWPGHDAAHYDRGASRQLAQLLNGL